MQLIKKETELHKFLKFNICVIVTSLLDVVCYILLLYTVFKDINQDPLPNSALLSLLGIKYKGYLYAYLISTTIGYVVAYLINRKITFKSDINPIYSGVLYFILAVTNILISSYIGGVFNSIIKAKNLSSPLMDIISKFVIINIPTIWTYPIERYVIQIQNKPKALCTTIATDLDGTLLKSDTNISRENLKAINNLAKNGVTIALLTGRTLYEVPEELRNCDGVEYIIYSNGAGIHHREKGLLGYTTISHADTQKVFDILSDYTTFIEIYACGSPYIEKKNYSNEQFEYYNIDKDFIPEIYKSRQTVDSLQKLIDDETYKIEMFDVFFKYQEEREYCRQRLLKEFDTIEITTSMTNNLEITPTGVNKGTALAELCKIMPESINDVIVLGDSKNDITAFKTSARKYAVSNACDEIKELADKVICSNDENIMCYMEKELL